jgi:hypothetical protein
MPCHRSRPGRCPIQCSPRTAEACRTPGTGRAYSGVLDHHSGRGEPPAVSGHRRHRDEGLMAGPPHCTEPATPGRPHARPHLLILTCRARRTGHLGQGARQDRHWSPRPGGMHYASMAGLRPKASTDPPRDDSAAARCSTARIEAVIAEGAVGGIGQIGASGASYEYAVTRDTGVCDEASGDFGRAWGRRQMR